MKESNLWSRLPLAYCVVTLGLMCINPSLTQYGTQRANLLLVCWMCASPLLLLRKDAQVWLPRIDIPLIVVALSATLVSGLLHPGSVRIATMGYTAVCCIFFATFVRMLKISNIGSEDLLRLIRVVVYAFSIMLLLQQGCVVAGIDVIGASHYYPLDNKWKLNSLATEASQASYVIGFCIYIYGLTLRHTKPGVSIFLEIAAHPWVWVCFLWIMISTQTATAVPMLLLCILPWLGRKSMAPCIGVGSCVVIILFLTTQITEWQPFMRVQRAAFATLSMDVDKIEEADISASGRIVPNIRGLKASKESSVTDLICGHGADADSRDLESLSCWQERGYVASAGIFKMLYNYGLAGALALIYLCGICTIVTHEPRTWLTFLLAIFMSAEFNLQFFWLTLGLALTHKYCIAGSEKTFSPRLHSNHAQK